MTPATATEMLELRKVCAGPRVAMFALENAGRVSESVAQRKDADLWPRALRS